MTTAPDGRRPGRAEPAASPAGYSGTPLVKKLGLREGSLVCPIDAPDDYGRIVGAPAGAFIVQQQPDASTATAHLFVTERVVLARQLRHLRQCLADEASLWVSWPKKASRMPTSVTEDVIREEALPLGFVDVKVCAVDQTWSALKLVVRKALRSAP